jgi:hypothetical protein
MAETHCAFGEVGFRVLWDGDLADMLGWEQDAYSASQHIPGSNRNVTFLLGLGPLRRTLRVVCDTQSHYDNLRAMRQTEATLRVYAAMNDLNDADVTEVNLFGTAYAEITDVLLLSTQNVRKAVDGSVVCEATFQREEPEV